jgi:alanine racemase
MTRATVKIDLNVLEENYRTIRDKVPHGVKMLCVVKADGYGHGVIRVAHRLEAIGADYFGVATIEEGIELRSNSASKPILVMGGLMPWDDTNTLWEYELTPVLADFVGLSRLARDAKKRKATIKAHVKVDTGMGRLGFGLDEMEMMAGALQDAQYIEVEGVMSHFASSEQRDAYGMSQIERFRNVVEYLNDRGVVPALVHMANSGGVCQYPEAYFGMVRLGILLYGSYPDSSLAAKIRVKPVMKLASRIAYVKTFPPGSALSYGRTFVTRRDTKVACVALGYSDGFPRALSNKGSALIQGRRCPIIGRVCMDWLLADVSELPDVEAGEEVILMGEAGKECITADEIAGHAGTIPYEILCGISKDILRVYV